MRVRRSANGATNRRFQLTDAPLVHCAAPLGASTPYQLPQRARGVERQGTVTTVFEQGGGFDDDDTDAAGRVRAPAKPVVSCFRVPADSTVA